MSKFHGSKKKGKKKSALKIIYMYPCMIVSKKKKCFNSRVDFITISWMHATYSLASLGSLCNNRGESREHVT